MMDASDSTSCLLLQILSWTVSSMVKDVAPEAAVAVDVVASTDSKSSLTMPTPRQVVVDFVAGVVALPSSSSKLRSTTLFNPRA